MSYQALARKWRPRDFSRMVGQQHVVRALINGLDNNKLHHAFLFTGTRGVGKTTIARILAKCLNCEQGVSSVPCGVCTACRELDEGRFVDLIEVDAASKAKVEETRELMDNVQFLPSRGRYKVYLIDEVHMFSGHSFNALLKTLEEPPSHVKFLLATTDPRKVPVTVLSRCLQFNLKRLPIGEIAGQLEHILAEEGIPAEEGVTRLIAVAADGSVRDGLSLLDQSISYCRDGLRIPDIEAMLGTVDREHIHVLLGALAAGDGNALMARVAVMAAEVTDFDGALRELLGALQRIAMIQVVPGAVADPGPDDEGMMALAREIPAEDVQLYYQIALMGRRDLPFAPEPRSGFEMILLRMLAFRPVCATEAVVDGRASARVVSSPQAADTPERRFHGQPSSRPGPAPGKDSPADEATVGGTPLAANPENWHRIVSALALTGVTRELAANCAFLESKQGMIRLCITPACAQLAGPNRKEKLENALRSYWGNDIRLTIEVSVPEADTPAVIRQRRNEERQQAAIRAIDEDPNVQALCATFDARVEKVTLD
uniref:DNA polymerase III subunit gamma/tau n=1 Tax=Candidatus Kentrum sp. FM TaxID=2126340 RepID=A0A450VLZ9_9GAMM|nr:MAG: DNA polymerase-3 subunit gamma/tau [Candidatus Kentron sp. FM]VFJ51373.1 MAG: DNA polymerase-3 subunit gamma/tau [Candidatus Kentron sp. FM]VFK05833.1 MAG: DNA polymerase-3 subunit gamma/tau [Candidatus Kentron sp. FM]